ncbi:glycoside hydrolase family 31 protein [Clostridium sp. KNHs205]|uniref:glycoside hydrolase family 31 protein n=1 Tax=Clostridium sp. KNHs205 TaxID=1449050 RepID=UPI00068AB40D|nr:glycoside hydrolase family 31 protein [Clostridium sp. KNHs205]
MFGKIVNFEAKQQDVEIVFENGRGTISIISDLIIHVFSKFEDNGKSKAIEEPVLWDTGFSAAMAGDCLVISTAKVTIKVYEDFMVDFYKADGSILCRDYRGERKLRLVLSEELIELMAKEGHQLKNEVNNHKLQVIKELEGDEYFYGLGDKTGFLNKRGYDYEMWNTDDPTPQVDSYKTLYKTIPFLITVKANSVYGIFFDNTNRSYWDMGKESSEYFYFAADRGNLDYYFFTGEEMKDIIKGYTALTGRVNRPQLWSLGYHQSRWGYETESDVRKLAKDLRDNHIPCDTIHLDIDYMEKYKVFTWNKTSYDAPKKMLQDLGKDGFKIVTIIDPGVKAEEGYKVYDEGVEKDYFVKTPEGEIYVNQVWPGDSVYPDFGNEKVREWWADNQKFLLDYGVRGVWNDMNEPASFQGEIPEDIVFSDEKRKATHGEMHNVYGHLMSRATYEGLKKYDKRRPFVITRACYSGSQKYTTAWTGDNHSIWAHLQMAVPQLCNLGLSGMSFVGTDVGGFGSDTTAELLTRWVQVGCFSPLFRNHSNKGSFYQEPWQFGKKTMDIYRRYVELRYKLLPYFYDLFVAGEQSGLPVLRPLVLHYETDLRVRECNDQFLVGESLLVAPVVMQGALNRMVYLPEGNWIDYWTGNVVEGAGYLIADAPLEVCPLYVKEGSIIPNYPPQEYVGEKEITALILDIYCGDGVYTHYQDDGESFDYIEGVYNQYEFSITKEGIFTAELSYRGYEKLYSSFILKVNGIEREIPFEGRKVEIKLSNNTEV